MAMGRHKPEQQTMWISQHQLAKGKEYPFSSRLNDLLAKEGFDSWAEDLYAPSIASKGRPSIPPGVSFRMLFIGYLEGFASDRAIAWNCQDRLSLRAFPGIPLHESTPDHSSLSIWRYRLPMEVYRAAFQRLLVHQQGLISAYAAGVDSGTIEANASLKRLTRKDTGATFLDYVKELILCAVADNAYHKAEPIKHLNRDQGITTCIPERDASRRRRWHGDTAACRQFHANRRRTHGNEGKRLSRLRPWLVERSFAFLKDSGNMARMTLLGWTMLPSVT